MRSPVDPRRKPTDDLLKIGEFAQLGHVSAAMLRNYDTVGLLHPAYVDPETDYRFYSLDQLARLNRILALKELGLSLNDVRDALDAGLPSGEIDGLLAAREDAIAATIATEQARLERLRNRRARLNDDGELHPLEVHIKHVPAMTVASYRQIIESGHEINDLFVGVHRALRARGHAVSLPIGLFHLDRPVGTYPHTGFAFEMANGRRVTMCELPGNARQDLEACFPIARPLELPVPFRDGQIRMRRLPPESHMASVVFAGPMPRRGEAGAVFLRWAAANDYVVRSPVREVYIRTDHDDTTQQNIVELQFPVSPRTRR